MINQIMVAAEKHGTHYYDASSPELLAKSALHLLTRRWREGYWYPMPIDYSSKYIATIAFKFTYEDGSLLSDADIDKLPVKVKEEALAERKKYQELQSDEKEYAVWYREAERIVKEQDLSFVTHGAGKYARTYPKAWDILKSRSDYPHNSCAYEGVFLEHVIGAGL